MLFELLLLVVVVTIVNTTVAEEGVSAVTVAMVYLLSAFLIFFAESGHLC